MTRPRKRSIEPIRAVGPGAAESAGPRGRAAIGMGPNRRPTQTHPAAAPPSAIRFLSASPSSGLTSAWPGSTSPDRAECGARVSRKVGRVSELTATDVPGRRAACLASIAAQGFGLMSVQPNVRFICFRNGRGADSAGSSRPTTGFDFLGAFFAQLGLLPGRCTSALPRRPVSGCQGELVGFAETLAVRQIQLARLRDPPSQQQVGSRGTEKKAIRINSSAPPGQCSSTAIHRPLLGL